MIADSVAFCREQGKRVGLRRRALLRRLPRRSRLRARMRARPRPTPGPRTSPSATPTAAACPSFVAAATAAVVAALGDAVEIGIHTHNDAECAVANSLAAVEAGARLVQGMRQRLRRALRQRQPRLDPAGAAAEDGLRRGHAPSSWRA